MRHILPLLLCALATAASCGGGDQRPVHALLITLDTTRYDALGCNRDLVDATPNLDALAAESIVYDRARTVSPLTMPSHSSILTGLYPLRHTVHANTKLALPQSATTLAERAKENGFQTGAFVAAMVLAEGMGLEQGFDRYDQPAGPLVQRDHTYSERPAEDVVDEAITWLRGRDPEKPVFLWTHFFDPHRPHVAPDDYHRPGRHPYLAEVARMDAAIGRLLQALEDEGLADDTMIVVVADHGEGIDEHDEPTHGALIYDSTIQVPLMIRHVDGWGAGTRSDEVVSVTDVAPTLVEALGWGGALDADGYSLFRRSPPPERGVYFESYYGYLSFGWSPLVGWADAQGKYLHSSEPEFYLPSDPKELNNAFRGEDQVRPYRTAIEALAEKPVLERLDSDVGAAGMVQHLQDLGYAGADVEVDAAGLPPPLETLGLRSPSEATNLHNAYLQAKAMLDEGRKQEGVLILETILRDDPTNHTFWFELGAGYLGLEDWPKAIEATTKAIEAGADWYPARINLGYCYDQIGDKPNALLHYKKAVEFAPQATDILLRIVDLLEDTGGSPEEIARYNMMVIEAREQERPW